MPTKIQEFLVSSAANIIYKNLGIICGMEITKSLLVHLSDSLPGGDVLKVIVPWVFGIAQNIISFIESFFSFFGALFSLELIGAGANFVSLIGTSAQLLVSVIVLVALANLFFKSISTP